MVGIKKWIWMAIWSAEIVVGLFLLGVSIKITAGIFLLLSGIASFFHDCYKEALKELRKESQ